MGRAFASGDVFESVGASRAAQRRALGRAAAQRAARASPSGRHARLLGRVAVRRGASRARARALQVEQRSREGRRGRARGTRQTSQHLFRVACPRDEGCVDTRESRRATRRVARFRGRRGDVVVGRFGASLGNRRARTTTRTIDSREDSEQDHELERESRPFRVARARRAHRGRREGARARRAGAAPRGGDAESHVRGDHRGGAAKRADGGCLLQGVREENHAGFETEHSSEYRARSIARFCDEQDTRKQKRRRARLCGRDVIARIPTTFGFDARLPRRRRAGRGGGARSRGASRVRDAQLRARRLRGGRRVGKAQRRRPRVAVARRPDFIRVRGFGARRGPLRPRPRVQVQHLLLLLGAEGGGG